MLTPGSPMYHPAIKYIDLINEPEIHLSALKKPKLLGKLLISAFDGILDAEKELNIKGPKPNFTVTFTGGARRGGSYCSPKYDDIIALAQMTNLQCAMTHPHKFGYEPLNDLLFEYKKRFVNSFNTPLATSQSLPGAP